MSVIRLCVVLIFLSLLSCKTKKEYTTTKIDEELIRKIEQIISCRDSIIISKKTFFDFSQITEVVEFEFDTDAPPDSSGNYPIKRKIVTKKDTTGEVKQEEDTKEGADINIKTEDNTTSIKKEGTTTKTEVKQSSSFKWFFITMSLVVLFVILIFLKRVGFFGN